MYFTALTLSILMHDIRLHDIRRKQLNILKTIHLKLFSLVVIFCLITVSARAVEWEERTVFEGNSGKVTLRVLSSTDTAIFSPMINRYLNENPEVNIEYLVASSSDIYNEFSQSPEEYDIVISSAMDLQLKLVNDGHAKRFDDLPHPESAQWRSSLYGFTLEPAAIVINRQAFAQLPIPQSRQQMIEVLRDNPEVFRAGVGTYDVRQSGLGYLFATQDARSSETYWRLMEIMGGLDTRLYCCSGDMIEDVADGTIAIAYNVLGSYALARSDLASKIEVVLPSDFPITMMRTAFVAADTQLVDESMDFLRYLTSPGWQDSDANQLPALDLMNNETQRAVIDLGPELLIFLDRMKRQTFIEEWENAVVQ